MSYRVILTANAKGDLRTYYRRAAKHAPVATLRWLRRFEAALATLAVNPQRCSLAPENDAVGEEISQFLFGKRGTSMVRAPFMIAEGEVRMLHIRRAVMDTATRDELYR
jgi:plasmid stabilization system protein ParE